MSWIKGVGYILTHKHLITQRTTATVANVAGVKRLQLPQHPAHHREQGVPLLNNICIDTSGQPLTDWDVLIIESLRQDHLFGFNLRIKHNFIFSKTQSRILWWTCTLFLLVGAAVFSLFLSSLRLIPEPYFCLSWLDEPSAASDRKWDQTSERSRGAGGRAGCSVQGPQHPT